MDHLTWSLIFSLAALRACVSTLVIAISSEFCSSRLSLTFFLLTFQFHYQPSLRWKKKRFNLGICLSFCVNLKKGNSTQKKNKLRGNTNKSIRNSLKMKQKFLEMLL